MRKSVRITLLCAAAVVVVLACFQLDFLLREEGFSAVLPLKEDELWKYHSTPMYPRSATPILLADEEQIVLFYRSEGIVNVYAPDGTFLHCYQVNLINRVPGDIASHEGILYVQTLGSRTYQFQNGTLISFTRPEPNSEEFERFRAILEGDPSSTVNGTSYLLSDNLVMKCAEDGATEEVFRLPKENPAVNLLLLFIIISFFGIPHYIDKGIKPGNS